MKYLITGGCGFLGSNLSVEVMRQGDELVVFDNLSRDGACLNLEWLNKQGKFNFIYGDIRNNNDVNNLVKQENPDIIFHLAGQVAMTTSINDPQKDFEVNALGSLYLLEAVRKYSSSSIIIYSSTNKVYGDLEWVNYEEQEVRYIAPKYQNGFSESIPLSFASPYGCSKGSADQYMLDYSKIFGLKTIIFRHSSMYGGRQFSTYDQGWVGWFCKQALDVKKGLLNTAFTISGNGKQVRDLLHVDDVIKLYFTAIEKVDNTKGEVYNIGGGVNNSMSLLELFQFLEKELDVKLIFNKLAPRVSDQKVFIADLEKIEKDTDWKPIVDKFEGVRKNIEWAKK